MMVGTVDAIARKVEREKERKEANGHRGEG